MRILLLAAFFALALPAQQTDKPTTGTVRGIFLSTADVTTCPYQVLSTITVRVKQDRPWDGAPQAYEAFPKLSNKARGLGADAVILVTASNAHFSLLSINSIMVTGRAVRFTDRTCIPKR